MRPPRVEQPGVEIRRRGRPVGWVLGLVTQLAALAVMGESLILRPVCAAPAVIVLASAGWVTTVLLHPEVRARVRRRRRARTPGH